MAAASAEDPLLDSEVFQIDDFTVITPLEMLVSQLEMTIHDWGLGKGSANNDFLVEKDVMAGIEWDSNSEKITVNEHHSLSLTHYWPKNIPRKPNAEGEDEIMEREDKQSYYTQALKLLTDKKLDFMPGSIIFTQFGVLEFLLLTPYVWSNDMIADEDQLNFIMSAVNIAVANAECDIPFFVQYGTFDRHHYNGVSQNDSVRTEFLTSCIARQLERHSHLDGLKDFFEDRMKIPYNRKIDSTVSVMIEYTLKERWDIKKRLNPVSGDFEVEYPPETLFIGNTSYLSFGATSDVLEKLCMCASWMNENPQWFTEDFDKTWYPFEAPFTFAHVTFRSGISCALHQNLKTLLNAASSANGAELISSILRDAGHHDANLGKNALASLTQPQTISITNPAGVDATEGMDPASIFRWIDAIFKKADFIHGAASESFAPAETSAPLTSAPGSAVKQSAEPPEDRRAVGTKKSKSNSLNKFMSNLEGYKAAPFNSLTMRIATALTQVLRQHESGTVAFAQLWVAVVRELRDRWETNRLLPGINEPFDIDHGACRLHQKLQMLQCCIDSRIRRHQKFDESRSLDQGTDEFFDAEDWISEESDSEVPEEPSGSTSLPACQGRNRQLDIRLIKHPETHVYEPFLQERCPMTEDMLEKYTEYLTSLESPETRAKAQLETLRSDMQAFKAANPGCIFEDFIRWHSPRDFISDETGEEGLSNRMKGEDNIWAETWRDARPQPIKSQKRLFNESKEAEAILQELSSLSVADLVNLLIPIVFKCATKQLLEESSKMPQLIEEKMVSFCEKMLICTRTGDTELYLDALRELNVMETAISQFNALWSRFCIADSGMVNDEASAMELRNFAQKLIETSRTSAKFGPLGGNDASIKCMVQFAGSDKSSLVGKMVQKLFRTDTRLSIEDEEESDSEAEQSTSGSAAQPMMPPFSRRQYIFRCSTPLPSIGSRPTPQRMYVSITPGGQFRMGTSITEDIVLQ